MGKWRISRCLVCHDATQFSRENLEVILGSSRKTIKFLVIPRAPQFHFWVSLEVTSQDVDFFFLQQGIGLPAPPLEAGYLPLPGYTFCHQQKATGWQGAYLEQEGEPCNIISDVVTLL